MAPFKFYFGSILFLVSFNAFAETYRVQLLFNFSSPTAAVKSYVGDIKDHGAVFENLLATSEEEAYVEAKKLLGTRYKKSIPVSVCSEDEDKCKKTTTGALIVGAEVYKIKSGSRSQICKVGDSLALVAACEIRGDKVPKKEEIKKSSQ